jgi:hypothetical protein
MVGQFDASLRTILGALTFIDTEVRQVRVRLRVRVRVMVRVRDEG